MGAGGVAGGATNVLERVCSNNDVREIMMSANTECRIEIRDFGVFEVKKTKAKPKARNPKTNEVIYVPAHRKTHFKPSKLLKSFLRQPLED